MKHLDLFSGIGGFALAAQQVWRKDYETIAFCDNDQFCQQVLKKNFPRVPIFGDIRTLTANPKHLGISKSKATREDSGTQPESTTRTKLPEPALERISSLWSKEAGWDSIDLITGGFPCQPFSQAGRKRGKEDDRYLWPEMLRVIKEFRPTWIIGENVAGIVNMVLNEVCFDLEAEGYEVQPIIIPAVALNAPHRRDRVWIIAYCKSEFGNTSRLSGREKPQDSRFRKSIKNENGNTSWERNWIEVAAEFCRVDARISNRVDRLKALGNAIVPAIAMEIMKAIKTVSENQDDK